MRHRGDDSGNNEKTGSSAYSIAFHSNGALFVNCEDKNYEKLYPSYRSLPRKCK